MSSAYTHGHAESVLRSHRARTAANSAAYLLPHLQPGQRLLDVGAGPGTITADLARLVAPGRVTALETSDAVVALTREGVEASGVENVDYLAGDVHALDLPDDSFDVVHAHQVLQHLPDPVQALREMVRVCRPGGVVAVRDADYSAFTWYPRARPSAVGSTCTCSWPGQTAASRTRVAGCSPGRMRPAARTSLRRRRSGVTPTTNHERPGDSAGPTAY